MPLHIRKVCSRTIVLSAVLGVVWSLGGCAAERAGAPRSTRVGSPTAEALVFATPAQRQTLALQAVEAPSESWAFSRNDRAVALRDPAPLLATSQWPEILPPFERPVQFHRWDQR